MFEYLKCNKSFTTNCVPTNSVKLYNSSFSCSNQINLFEFNVIYCMYCSQMMEALKQLPPDKSGRGWDHHKRCSKSILYSLEAQRGTIIHKGDATFLKHWFIFIINENWQHVFNKIKIPLKIWVGVNVLKTGTCLNRWDILAYHIIIANLIYY